MTSISPRACDKCKQLVITATMFASGGLRIVLDATPVPGGDYATWPIGYDPGNLRLLAARRPRQVATPFDLPEHLQATWDGYAKANERSWYVEHVHGVSAAEIVNNRRSTST
ncbi:hypothetical protein E1295_31775 [Nonomuraea mesophila]|uniref:Uncharacterized protein n=1 Tax=Nonomuraea mesophila TaxID=2530382 RepID=A0A4R5EZH7_9ACTN|nr:hypothetical protein [Nonomuraea mesophila]TDE40481.1 hypothetical protein E1295_31775 [Nonomuraea mesophila]